MKSNWGCKKKAKCFLWWKLFEGNNHTIKNLNIIQNNPNDDNYYYGLFAWNSGTIQNLNIINANIDCDRVSYIGGIACVNEGNINHVRLMALLV